MPNTTKRKPTNKKGDFEKNHQVGFKMEKITKTFLLKNKPSGGVKRKIELFESLSKEEGTSNNKHTKLHRMETDFVGPDRNVARSRN